MITKIMLCCVAIVMDARLQTITNTKTSHRLSLSLLLLLLGLLLLLLLLLYTKTTEVTYPYKVAAIDVVQIKHIVIQLRDY